jgi:hypothetical protein
LWPEADDGIFARIDMAAFEQEGFALLRGAVPRSVVAGILSEVEFIIRDQMVKFGAAPLPEDTCFNELVRASFVPGSEQRHFLYNFLRHVPTLRAFSSSQYLVELIRHFGFRLPLSFETPTIRFDIPGEDKFLTRHHQDLRSIRSSRAVTLWFPLVPVNEELGTVLIYPGSHRLGIQSFSYDSGQLNIDNRDALGEALILEADPGDLLVFDSMAVHASVPGKTDRIKINCQCFWNDAAEVDTHNEFWELSEIPDAQDIQKQPASK